MKENMNEVFPDEADKEKIQKIINGKTGKFCRACGIFESDCLTPFGFDSEGRQLCQSCLEKRNTYRDEKGGKK